MALVLEQLKDRLGLDSVRQVRRRIDLARSLLTPYIRHGRNNQLFLDGSGVALLDRLLELEKQGRTIEQAVEDIGKEMEDGPNGKPRETKSEPGGNPEVSVLQVKVELLEERLSELNKREEDLILERNRLLSIIENKDEQLRALMPGPSDSQDSEAEGNNEPARLSRWQHLKAAVFGR